MISIIIQDNGIIITPNGKIVLKDYEPRLAIEFHHLLVKLIRKFYKDKFSRIKIANVHLYAYEKYYELSNQYVSSLVAKNIIVTNKNGCTTIGVDPTAKYKSMPILSILKSIEYGTSSSQAYPVMRAVIKYILLNIEIYWDQYLMNVRSEI